jgi:DNA-binding SARP family transcriptional activator
LIRVYLAGEVQLESGARLVREADLPARQGRMAFALLADRRAHPVARQELADVLWPDRLPEAWAVALSAIISKLRVALEGVGLSRDSTIVSALGCYQLRLPEDAWVDLEVAAAAIHTAEAEVSRGRADHGYGDALVALTSCAGPSFRAPRGVGWRTGARPCGAS